jgi:hypothetical protein
MIIKTILISVILVAIVMLALGIKMLFDKNAKFTVHSCSLEHEEIDSDDACYKCQLKNMSDCPDLQEYKI